MSEMMKSYQEINKRRQSDEMDVNSLTMFAEAWNFQQVEVDSLQKKYDDLDNRATGIVLSQMDTAKLNYELQKQVITQGQNFNDQAQKLKDVEYFNQKLQGRIDDALIYLRHTDFRECKESILFNILKGNEDD